MKNPFKKSNGLFFWQKNKAEDMLQLYIKYIPEIRKIMNEGNVLSAIEGETVGRMYDYYRNYDDQMSSPMDFDGDMPMESKDSRIVATPLSVMVELETVPTPFTVEKLDEKIATLKDKTKLLSQRYAKEQIIGLCKRLENRKKYRDEVSFYSSFPNTTDEKIDVLLAKYKLEINTSDLFIPTFPKDAIDIMKKYTEVTNKISGENPVFYVIAEQKDFVKKREKLDPILLVQSPFGFYWQILGAWDKEMLLLSEL